MDPLAEQLAATLRRYPAVRVAYLFGSAARDRLRAASDVDVGIAVAPGWTAVDHAALQAALEEVAGRSVDLVELAAAPPLLAREIVAGRLLVARDDTERAELELRVHARYLDTAHLRRVQHHYLRERIEARRARER